MSARGIKEWLLESIQKRDELNREVERHFQERLNKLNPEAVKALPRNNSSQVTTESVWAKVDGVNRAVERIVYSLWSLNESTGDVYVESYQDNGYYDEEVGSFILPIDFLWDDDVIRAIHDAYDELQERIRKEKEAAKQLKATREENKRIESLRRQAEKLGMVLVPKDASE